MHMSDCISNCDIVHALSHCNTDRSALHYMGQLWNYIAACESYSTKQIKNGRTQVYQVLR